MSARASELADQNPLTGAKGGFPLGRERRDWDHSQLVSLRQKGRRETQRLAFNRPIAAEGGSAGGCSLCRLQCLVQPIAKSCSAVGGNSYVFIKVTGRWSGAQFREQSKEANEVVERVLVNLTFGHIWTSREKCDLIGGEWWSSPLTK